MYEPLHPALIMHHHRTRNQARIIERRHAAREQTREDEP
jgi:hypothetical protein